MAARKSKSAGPDVSPGARVDRERLGSESGLLPRVRCLTADGQAFLVVQEAHGDEFSLWRDGGDGKLTCEAVAESPLDLYGLVPWGIE